MNSRLQDTESGERAFSRSDLRQLTAEQMPSIPVFDAAARAAMVNRTHRVVRQRAQTLQDRRTRARSLWIPLLVCSALLLILCTGVWTILDEYELAPTGYPDASQQILVLLLWFLPLSAALLALVWFRRTRIQKEEDQAQ